jgi:Holliday junction resolvasome RuvABC ATP-dependent DNA helicase subunit
MSIWDTPTTDVELDARQLADEVPFIGQTQIKSQVEPFIEAEKFPHVLLTGEPGLGKTQFGRWLAWRRQKPFFERLAPVKPESLPPYGVLLLDEVHRQSDVESLFPVMDKGVLTVIAATTKPDKLDSAFRSRFLLTPRLRFYWHEEIIEIINTMAGGEGPSRDIAHVLATASSGNPRIAERIVMTAQGLGTWEPKTVLRAAQITADGLSQDHFDYLKALQTVNRPVGLKHLVDQTMMSEDTVKRVERLLVSKGHVELASNGRKLTLRGDQYVSMLEDEGVL